VGHWYVLYLSERRPQISYPTILKIRGSLIPCQLHLALTSEYASSKHKFVDFFLGILVAAIGVTTGIVAFQSPLLRGAGIAACLCGLYIMKRSSRGRLISKRYVLTSFDSWIYTLFAVTFILSLIAYALLYFFAKPSYLVGYIILYSFIIFAMLTTIIGSFLFARWVYRGFR
jgi:hypothetical protein